MEEVLFRDCQSVDDNADSGEDWGGVGYENSDGDLIESLEALVFSDEYWLEVAEYIFPHFRTLQLINKEHPAHHRQNVPELWPPNVFIY